MFTSNQITPFRETMYIPYQINAINYCKIDRVDINAISAPFSGCLMVAWQVGGKTFVGHVAKDNQTKVSQSFETWEKTKVSFERYVEFDPWRLLVKPQNTKTCFGMIVFNYDMEDVTGYSLNTETDILGVSRIVNQIKGVNLRWK